MARGRATDNNALLCAAAEVFESKGYRNATIDDIAEAAGISRPTVYKYTTSKRSLLDKMVDTVCDDLDARLRAVVYADLPPIVRLRQLITLHVDRAGRMKSFYSIVFSEQAELSEKASRRFTQFSHDASSDFQTLLAECLQLRHPDSPAIDTRIGANLVLSMLTTLYRWYDPNGPIGPAELIDQILSVLVGIVPITAIADSRAYALTLTASQ